jgi:hypothetical protein
MTTVLARVLPLVFCFFVGAAYGVLPPDACVPPSPLPASPTAQADSSVTFTAYSEAYQSTIPFTVIFWREPCAGQPGHSLLYLRVIPGAGAYVCGGFRIVQDSVQYQPTVDDSLGGSILCTSNFGLATGATYLIEQDYRNSLFSNSGAVTLLHIGSVSSSASLPAYSGSGAGASVVPQVGLWWNPNESGTGYSLDYKHGVLVVTIYSYTAAGAAQWYIASGPLNGFTFTAPLYKAINGQCISCVYKPYVGNGNDGTITITFSAATSATAYLPGGRITQIQPEPF